MRHAAHHRYAPGNAVQKSSRKSHLVTPTFFNRHPVLREIGRFLVALANVIVIGALILVLAGCEFRASFSSKPSTNGSTVTIKKTLCSMDGWTWESPTDGVCRVQDKPR